MNSLVQSTLPVTRIVQGKNPREYFDPRELARLEESIRAAEGVLQPIVVRLRPGDDNLYEIVAGERRWRAAKNVFGDAYEMPVVIRELNDTDAAAFAIIENHHRAAMSHAEEAQAAKRLLMRLHGDKTEAARNLGWSPDVLEHRLALLTCTPDVLTALTQRRIQLGHAELLAGIPPGKQNDVLAAVIERNVSVTTLKSQLGRYARRLADALFDTATCTGCPHNSARQSGLFDESLGEGFCQHPTHYDELIAQAVETKAEALREQYPVVKIAKAGDCLGFVPVAAEGALGVGFEQYSACKACASFGCAVSATPGSHGEVTHSLCFDAACNSRKVSAWRKAARSGESKTAPVAPQGAAARPHKTPAAKPVNHLPQRVVDFRVSQWRRWAANELMANPEKNRRVLIALARSGRSGDVRVAEFAKVTNKIAGPWAEGESIDFGHALRQADALDAAHLDRLVLAVTAAAAFGVSERHLVALLNEIEVDERRHFKWDRAFLELFTMSELEALAEETRLRSAMGVGFKLVRARKKPEFIAALLSVPGFAYDGTVPAVMRYPRHENDPALPGKAQEQGEEETGALAT